MTDSTFYTDVFIHIPKTAGTTLYNVIARQYAHDETYLFRESKRQAPAAIQAHYSREARGRLRFVGGHMAFGLHALLPQPTRYFTFLRHPVDRVVSFYNHIIKHPEHYLHDALLARQMNLSEFVKSHYTVFVENAQTRHVSGVYLHLPYGETSEQTLIDAKRNLEEKFVCVGLTEQFDTSLLLLKKALGWQGDLVYSRQNVSSDRRKKETLPPETIEIIEQHNQYDLQLYQFGLDLFEKQKVAYGVLLADDLHQLQQKNERHQRFQAAKSRLQTLSRFSVRTFVKENLLGRG